MFYLTTENLFFKQKDAEGSYDNYIKILYMKNWYKFSQATLIILHSFPVAYKIMLQIQVLFSK